MPGHSAESRFILLQIRLYNGTTCPESQQISFYTYRSSFRLVVELKKSRIIGIQESNRKHNSPLAQFLSSFFSSWSFSLCSISAVFIFTLGALLIANWHFFLLLHYLHLTLLCSWSSYRILLLLHLPDRLSPLLFTEKRVQLQSFQSVVVAGVGVTRTGLGPLYNRYVSILRVLYYYHKSAEQSGERPQQHWTGQSTAALSITPTDTFRNCNWRRKLKWVGRGENPFVH